MLLTLHITLIFATLAVVLYADEQAFLWIRGAVETLPKRRLEWLHALTGLGLAGLITTGGLMFLQQANFLLSNPTFLIKMVFVAALIINGFFISVINTIATMRSWSSLSTRERLPLLISGAISTGSWAGAGICGLLL